MKAFFLITMTICMMGSTLQAQQSTQPSDFFPYHAGDTAQYWDKLQGGFRTVVYYRDSTGDYGQRFLFDAYNGKVSSGKKLLDTNDTITLLVDNDSYLLFDLRASLGEAWSLYKGAMFNWRKFVYESDTTIFGVPATERTYMRCSDSLGNNPVEYHILAAGFGEVISAYPENANIYYLTGAFIGGKHYGTIFPIADVRDGRVADNELRCVPNPATAAFTLHIPQNKPVERVMLYDALGRCVANKEQPTETLSFDVRGLSFGAYRIAVWYRDGSRESVGVIVNGY